jgi:hypothetical protein
VGIEIANLTNICQLLEMRRINVVQEFDFVQRLDKIVGSHGSYPPYGS